MGREKKKQSFETIVHTGIQEKHMHSPEENEKGIK